MLVGLGKDVKPEQWIACSGKGLCHTIGLRKDVFKGVDRGNNPPWVPGAKIAPHIE